MDDVAAAAAPKGLVPTTSSVSALSISLLEPNWLILCSYLAINVYLTRKVLQVATSRKVSGTPAVVESKASSSKSRDTPAADSLIHISVWAFKDDAQNAKRVISVLAILSLSSTWYFMFAFLHHSYINFITTCHLQGCRLPPLAPNLQIIHPSSIIPSLHLRVLRISQWLQSISLFKEAWMEVIKDPLSWWWSSEICLITVGPWALFLFYEGKRLQVGSVWAFMALGQLVAISFAFNLFNLGVVSRVDTSALAPLAMNETAKKEAVGPQKMVTSVTVRKINLSSRIARVPETVILTVLAAAGIGSVLQHPDTFPKVMMMHMFPMLIVLLPRIHTHHGMHTLSSPTQLYLALGAACIYLRLQLTLTCFRLLAQDGLLTTSKNVLFALFPITFLRHPAQSSISSDHVSVAVSVVAFIALESGVWLSKLAATSPSCTRETADIALDESDLRSVERQALAVVALVLLSPVLGASGTLSLYLALRSTWTEAMNYRDGTTRDLEHDRNYQLCSKDTVRKIVETDAGKVLEIRETVVSRRR